MNIMGIKTQRLVIDVMAWSEICRWIEFLCASCQESINCQGKTENTFASMSHSDYSIERIFYAWSYSTGGYYSKLWQKHKSGYYWWSCDTTNGTDEWWNWFTCALRRLLRTTPSYSYCYVCIIQECHSNEVAGTKSWPESYWIYYVDYEKIS